MQQNQKYPIFYSEHASMSKSGTFISHNATQLLASSKDDERATKLGLVS